MEIKNFNKIEDEQEINQKIKCNIKFSNGMTAIYRGNNR